MTEERNPTKVTQIPPTIPDESIGHVIELSEDIAIWCKPIPGGFQFTNQDKTIPEIIGYMVGIVPYLINFDSGDRAPAKLPHVASDLEIPEGYSRRCDVKIKTADQIIGLSLAPSSVKYQLSPYLKYLRNQGLRPEQVPTRLTSRTVSNNMGSFQVVVFEVAESRKEITPSTKKTPSETPPPEQTSFYIPKEWA